MRAREALALALLAVLALAASAGLGDPQNAGPRLAYVRLQGRLEYGYALIFLKVNFSEPVEKLTLNLSGFDEKVLVAIARVDGEQVLGRVSEGLLEFRPSHKFRVADLTLVIDALSFNSSAVTVALPVPLAPLEAVSRVAGDLVLGSSFTATASLGNFSQGVAKYNTTVAPGARDVLRAWASLSSIEMVKVRFLNRTVLLSPGRAEFIDSLQLVSEGGLPVTTLRLTLPSACKLEAIEASLFTYPSRYVSQYSAGNATLLLITLLPALEGVGQVGAVTLRYSVPFNGSLDVYMGLGPLVRNYSVRVCIEGAASITPSPLTSERVGPLQCYELPGAGPLLQAGMYPPASIVPSFAPPSGALTPHLLIAWTVTAAVLGGMGYLALRQSREDRERVLSPAPAAAEVSERVRSIAAQRRDNIAAMIRQLREYRAQNVGMAKIINYVNTRMKSDQALSSEMRSLLASLGERGERAREALSKIDDELSSCVKSLLEVERMYRRGRLDKQAYRSKVSELEERLLKASEELEKLYRHLGS